VHKHEFAPWTAVQPVLEVSFYFLFGRYSIQEYNTGTRGIIESTIKSILSTRSVRILLICVKVACLTHGIYGVTVQVNGYLYLITKQLLTAEHACVIIVALRFRKLHQTPPERRSLNF
jgi:succinate dehydrogenase/fumarate reductase cytochrome b subunit